MNKTRFRLQSAMEYLMTYGWAILIIAIVLGVLYYIGVFNGAAALGTSCIATPGFLCQNPIMSSTGYLSFTLGQESTATEYNIGLSCAAVSTSSGLPYSTVGTNVFWYPSATGAVSATGNTVAPALNLGPGQQVGITGLPCYTNTGVLESSSSPSIGSTFTGTLWLNYTSSPTVSGWITNKMATVTVKVT
ncbi:MAG: hypothetical protein QXF01_02500 [Candidatus Micrarchaeaceae archaeon]